MEFSFGTISNFKRKVPRYFKQNEHEILSSFYQVNAISEQALKQKVDTVSNKASRLWNEAPDDFLSQTFAYEANSINAFSVSVNDSIDNEDCYENETLKYKNWSVYQHHFSLN